MIKTITIPEDICNQVKKANVEKDSRRDILTYIMQYNIHIPTEQFDRYQKEYDEKFLAFEEAKNNIEKEYVMPATNGRALNWSLNYSNCVVSITLPDE